MNKVYKMKALLLACLALTVFLTSCDDDEKSSSQIELLSFGPSGGSRDGEITFIGNNLDKVTAVVMPVDIEVAASAFKVQTRDKIVFDVPVETGFGKVVLKTPQGDIESKSVYAPDAPITITSFTESVKPGENITIEGDYLNFVSELWFADGVLVTDFVSQSRTELVATVPMEAQTGKIALVRVEVGPEGLVVESETDVIITLPTITGLSPNPVERGGSLTITGEDLDLTKQVEFKGGVIVDEFVSVSETELVVTVPEEANQGRITLVAYSGITIESEDFLQLVGALPPLEPLGLVIYDDAPQNGWQKWGGWGGGSADLDNGDNVRDGEKSAKVVFGGDWGGPLQMGGSSSTDGFTKFAFAIYGEVGTGGQVLNVIVKGGATEEKQITITEGEWVEFELSLADDFGSPATITEFFLQDRGWSGTIFIDHIGLR